MDNPVYPGIVLGSEKWVKGISTILQKGGFEDFFFRKGLDEKGLVNFMGGVSGFLEIPVINLTSRLLFDVLFTRRLKDVVSLAIFNLFMLLKVF